MRHRTIVGMAVALLAGCAEGRDRLPPGSLVCPPGTTHKGGRPDSDGEFCWETGSVKRHGPERTWWPDSTVIGQEGTWDHGKREGMWITRWENGRTSEAGRYAANKMVGVWRRWGDAGELRYERTYDNQGELHGMAWSWSTADWVEIRCFVHGLELWMTRDPKAARTAACPGPVPTSPLK